MNFLQQINNPLIDNSTNRFRTIVKRAPYDFYGRENFYSKKISFDIPREYNNLCGIWIKITATTAAETADIQLQAGDYHFRSVSLRTKNGVPIATNTDRYYDIRSDEVGESLIGQSMADAMNPTDRRLTTTPRSFYVPMFSFFTEDRSKMLPTKYMEPLEVVCLTNTSKETMGLSQELTSAQYEIFFVFYDDVDGSAPFDGLDMVAYDIYEEPVIPNASAATTIAQTLTCPYPTFCTHFCVRERTVGNYTDITNIKFDVAGNVLTDIDNKIMFDLFCDSGAEPDSIITNTTEIKHYYHCSETGYKARHFAKDFVVFNGSMIPFRATLTLSAGDALDNAYTVHEYKFILRITKEGKVIRVNSDDIIFNKALNV
jgi:hypothetical protein